MNASSRESHDSCHNGSRIDWLLWGSLSLLIAGYTGFWLAPDLLAQIEPGRVFGQAVFELINKMWWGILIGILALSVLSKIPREFVSYALGPAGTVNGIFRAGIAGIMLDLCSHGVLMVGAKLYERGASTGQVMAFLIASPWNSLSLTLILIALVGLKWALSFIFLSLIIAIISGLIFDLLEKKGILPENKNSSEIPEDFAFWPEAQKRISEVRISFAYIRDMLINGLSEARMVLRWIFFGVVLAALIRSFVSPDMFADWFGPTLAGLGLTLIAATILEVCSEGTLPVAADILNRAGAPGNSFAFLMAGVATDYTEIMVLKETTGRWKIPLFLPLIAVPQIVLVAYFMNLIATAMV